MILCASCLQSYIFVVSVQCARVRACECRQHAPAAVFIFRVFVSVARSLFLTFLLRTCSADSCRSATFPTEHETLPSHRRGSRPELHSYGHRYQLRACVRASITLRCTYAARANPLIVLRSRFVLLRVFSVPPVFCTWCLLPLYSVYVKPHTVVSSPWNSADVLWTARSGRRSHSPTACAASSQVVSTLVALASVCSVASARMSDAPRSWLSNSPIT